MATYLAYTHRLLKQFKTYQIQQLPRSDNNCADALSQLASTIDDQVRHHVPIKVLTWRSTTEAEVHDFRQDPC